MAATIVTRAGGVAASFLKPIASAAIVLLTDGAARAGVTTSPTLSAGAGAPTAAAADGSVYARTDGATDTTLYLRISGSWVAATVS